MFTQIVLTRIASRETRMKETSRPHVRLSRRTPTETYGSDSNARTASLDAIRTPGQDTATSLRGRSRRATNGGHDNHGQFTSSKAACAVRSPKLSQERAD